MKNKSIIYMIVGLLIGVLITSLLGKTSLIRATDQSTGKTELTSSQMVNQSLSAPSFYPVATKNALCWVNGFRDFNKSLSQPLMSPIASEPNVCSTVDSVPNDLIHSWFISEDDLKLLLKQRQGKGDDAFAGIRIYPALRQQPYKLGQTQGLLENAMTLVICPTFEKAGTYENQYNIVSGDTNIVSFEFLPSCPEVCPSETFGKFDLSRKNYPQTNCAEPCQ